MKNTKRGRLSFTLIDAVQTNRVQHKQHPWIVWADHVAHRLVPHTAATKEERNSCTPYPLIAGIRMKTIEEGAKTQQTHFLKDGSRPYSRSDANFVHMDALILDFDNDPKHVPVPVTLEQIKQRLNGYEFVYWTSWSHGSDKYGSVPLDMFRVVLPLKDSVTAEQFRSRLDALEALFPEADKAFKRVTQPYYLPIVHPDRAALFQRGWQDSGEWFDLLALPETVRPAPSEQPSFQLSDEYTKNAGEIYIRLKAGGREVTAADLYDRLNDGETVTTYRVGDPSDRNPGAYVRRVKGGLDCRNEDGSKNCWIQIKKTIRTEQEEDTTLVLKKRAKPPVEAEQRKTIRMQDLQRLQAMPGLPGFQDTERTVKIVNEQYLPELAVDLIPPRGVFVVQSPKGTGKTTMLKRVVADCDKHDQSVMLLGHRVFLLSNLSTRTNLKFYQDLETGTLTRDVAVCLNSLASRLDPKRDKPYHTIIIDESEQVLQALVSRTLEGVLSEVFNNLLWLFKHAERIICLDADLSAELTINLIAMMRGHNDEDDCAGLINEYKPGVGKTTKAYMDKYHLMFDVIADIEAGEKVFVATNNKRYSTVLHKIVTEVMGKEALLVSADTAEGDEQQAFIQNPAAEAKKYDAVFTTPTLSTGVSIDEVYFTRVYGIFDQGIGTYQDADQAVSRVRKCDDVRVWLQPSATEPKIPSEETLKATAIRRELGSLKMLPGEEIELTKGALLWADIYARIHRMVALWSCNKGIQFRAMRDALGFTVEIIVPSMKKSDEMRELYGDCKHVQSTYAADVWAAEVLDRETFEDLLRKKQKTSAEHLAVERYRYAHDLGELFTESNLELAIAEKMMSRLTKMKMLVTANDDKRIDADKEDRQRNRSTFTVSKHRVQQHELFSQLCAAVQVDLPSMHAHVAAQARGDKLPDIEITGDMLEKAAKAFASRADDFNLYFNMRFEKPLDPQNYKQIWNRTFGEIAALSIKKKRLTNADGQRTARYFVDPVANSLALQVIDTQLLSRLI